MPPEFMGRWTTANLDYADRYFQLTGRELVLGTGAGTSERYRVSRVLHARDDEGDLYTVEYADSRGGDYKMSLYFDATNGGSVRFKNQPRTIWRKAAS